MSFSYYSFAIITSFLRYFALAYDFTVTSKGGFYESITDMSTGEQIGELFQNPAINPDGKRIGTSQGFAYNFATDSSPDYANRNWIFFLDDGIIQVMDQTIVSGSGSYEKYTNGRVEQRIQSVDPEYISEITLVEPTADSNKHHDEITDGDDDGDDNTVYTFRITKDGGYDNPLSAGGIMFQSPILVQNATTGLWEQQDNNSQDQGFGYMFSGDSYTEMYKENSMSRMIANRIFFLPDGELTVLNDAIVQGRGKYAKYTGGTLNEAMISLMPYVAEITLLKKHDEKEPVDTLNSGIITFALEAGESESITNGDDSSIIGMKIQGAVFNKAARIGTMLSYYYSFPNPAGVIANGNRNLLLEDGTVTIFNDAIVGATGAYVDYNGGRAMSTTTDEIALIPPGLEVGKNEDNKSPASGCHNHHFSTTCAGFFLSLVWLIIY